MKKSHSVGYVLDPTRYENHNPLCTSVCCFQHVLFLYINFINSLVHTSIQRLANWCRFRNRSTFMQGGASRITGQVMLSNVPMLFYIVPNIRWNKMESDIYIYMRMAFPPF